MLDWECWELNGQELAILWNVNVVRFRHMKMNMLNTEKAGWNKSSFVKKTQISIRKNVQYRKGWMKQVFICEENKNLSEKNQTFRVLYKWLKMSYKEWAHCIMYKHFSMIP